MESSQLPHPELDRPNSGPGQFHMVQKLKQNLEFRTKWAELNGAMGDLGTYIPIILSLTLAKNLNLGTTLIFTGIYNLITGAIYGVPMPVQPMKSIAAVAISDQSFSIPEVMSAGICTAGILFILGVTGLMKIVYKLIPLPVVRGIQLAQGLSFALTAVKYIRKEQNLANSKSIGDRPWLGLDGLLLALTCACFIILVNGPGPENGSDSEGPDRRPIPSAFLIFLVGVILAIVREPDAVKHFKLGPARFQAIKIDRRAWKLGFIKGTIPQLPLSILNSVIAVCNLSADIFPDRPEVSATSVSISVGMMNLVGCWFGAMPCCHGAGGLAGQYKFGGRTGGCVAVLGAAKVVVGVVLGSSVVRVLEQFPEGVLGVLLLFAGIELAVCARDMKSKEEWLVVAVCTAVSLVGSSAAVGFLCGMVVYLLLRLRKVKQPCASSWLDDDNDHNP